MAKVTTGLAAERPPRLRSALSAAVVVALTALVMGSWTPGGARATAGSNPQSAVGQSGSRQAGLLATRQRAPEAGAPVPTLRASSLNLPILGAKASPTPVPSATPTPTPTPTPAPTPTPPAGPWVDYAHVAIVNYIPGADGYDAWAANPPDVGALTADFDRVAALHANTVRMAISYTQSPGSDAQMRIGAVLQAAQNAGVRVDFSLFDQYTAYDTTWSEPWVQQLLSPWAGDPRIAFVEVQNEMDPTNSAAMGWARALIPYIQGLAGGIPVTISEGGWCNGAEQIGSLKAGLGWVRPDFWSIHYYCGPAAASGTFRDAKAAGAPLPVIIGEAGYATISGDPSMPNSQYGTPWQEAEQSIFFAAVDDAALANGLAPAGVWTMDDLVSSACSGCASVDSYFGLYRIDGSAKPAAATVAAEFAGVTQAPDDNLGAEEDASGFPVAWTIQDRSLASFNHDSTVAHTGSWSLEIANATRAKNGSEPSWILDLPAPIVAGRTYTAASWVLGSGIQGAVNVVLIWNDDAGRGLGYAVSPALPAGTTGWTRLSISSVAPQGAAFAQIALSSVAHGAVWFDDASFQ